MKRGVVVILTFTLSPLAGWTAGAWHAGFAARHASRPAPVHARPAAETAPASSVPLPGNVDWGDLLDPTAGPAEHEDIYGNEISPAIATYKRDASGGVYEEHSPQTEVAKLKAPVT